MRTSRFFAAVVVVTVVFVPGSAGATKPSPLPPGPALFKAGAAVAVSRRRRMARSWVIRATAARRRRSTGCAGSRSRSRIATTSRPGTSRPGTPIVDCNGNGRWDGILLGGGADTPRFASVVADDVTARALVVSNRHHDDRGRGARPRRSVQRVSGAHPRQGARPTAITSTTSSSPRPTTNQRPTRSASRASTRLTSGVDAYYVDFLVAAIGEGDRRRVRPSAPGASSSTPKRSSPRTFASAGRRIRSSTIS